MPVWDLEVDAGEAVAGAVDGHDELGAAALDVEDLHHVRRLEAELARQDPLQP